MFFFSSYTLYFWLNSYILDNISLEPSFINFATFPRECTWQRLLKILYIRITSNLFKNVVFNMCVSVIFYGSQKRVYDCCYNKSFIGYYLRYFFCLQNKILKKKEINL